MLAYGPASYFCEVSRIIFEGVVYVMKGVVHVMKRVVYIMEGVVRVTSPKL